MFVILDTPMLEEEKLNCLLIRQSNNYGFKLITSLNFICLIKFVAYIVCVLKI